MPSSLFSPLTTRTVMMMYPSPTAITPTSSKTHFELFVSTRSRVIRAFDISRAGLSSGFLLSLLTTYELLPSSSPSTPAMSRGVLSLWTLREEWGGRPVGEEESVWVVFRSHEQALMALGRISARNAVVSVAVMSMLSATTALESDLEPTIKLRKVEPRRNSMPFRQVHSISDLRTVPFYPLSLSLSSLSPNPPSLSQSAVSNGSTGNNSNVTFRQGDWICICNAHNFMRNTLCIACNSPRHTLSPSSPASPPSTSSSVMKNNSGNPNPSSNPNKVPIILTPSGRALAIGGKVQNVSRDPMAPCIIFWPDNEPFPDQRQIRPAIQYGALPGSQPPPILNTGNKGPIEQQPGDWVCGKCEYLNWRRRKVCQTCYPYAEGNADGVSPIVQAERLSVLAQVLGVYPQPTMQTQAPMPMHMSPATSSSSSSLSTSTSADTHSPRSSPSTSILSVPLPSPKSDEVLDTISLCPSHQHVHRHHHFHNPHHLILSPYLTKEGDRGRKDGEWRLTSNLNVVPISGAPPTTHPTSMDSLSSTSTSAIIRRQSSLTFTPGYHHHPSMPTSNSIWTMRQDELERSLGLGLGPGS